MSSADADIGQVIGSELALLSPEVRGSPDRVLALLDREFREFGASGATWDRTSIAAALSPDDEKITAKGMHALRLGPDAVLLTYLARQGDRATLRSSVWVRRRDGWKLLFHQGTPTEQDNSR